MLLQEKVRLELPERTYSGILWAVYWKAELASCTEHYSQLISHDVDVFETASDELW